MDLGIAGRTAFLAASSQGLGLACASALAREGVNVILNGRNPTKLEVAANQLRATYPQVKIDYIAADLTCQIGLTEILYDLPDIDILVTNNAGPAPGTLQDWDEMALLEAMQANLIPAVQLMRALIPAMRERGFGRIVNITSAMVKSPMYEMGLSTAARAALTAISKAISKDAARDNVTLNNLLPERIDTPRQEFMAQRLMKAHQLTREQARERIASTIAARRLGTPEEFADACAYLCSAQAGYISGQNLQLDGGSYEGLI